MADRKNILFLTSSEYGQANVVLAIAHELALKHDLDIHIASFLPLQPRVIELSETISKNDSSKSVVFHSVAGLSMIQMLSRIPENEMLIGPHPTGFNGALSAYRALPQVLAGWSGPEYMETADSCIEVIRNVKPCIVVIDSFFGQGIIACTMVSQQFMILSPNSMKDIVTTKQPKGAMFWKYPASCSAFPYPLPWSYIPANIYLNIRLIIAMVTSPRIREFTRYCSERGVKKLPFMDPGQDDVQHLCPSVRECDFDFEYIPPNVTPCGPITLIVPPVSKSDPELAAWLKQRPTIMLNLGSHMVSDANDVKAMATAFRIVLERCPGLQVLWKLKSKAEMMEYLSQVIDKEMASEIVRVESWMEVDPLAILQTGNVICSIHHGGANSYFESVQTGVPHVVLPLWYDTFDYATRVEYLGIGAYGSRDNAPHVEVGEFSKAILRVVDEGEEAKSMRRKAKELAAIAVKAGGRTRAAERIIEEIGKSM